VEFHPESFDQFRLTGFEADPESRTAVLRYALDDEHRFEERLKFGWGQSRPGLPVSEAAALGFERVVRLLHLAAGVSYYKTAAPRCIVVETGAMSESEMRLFSDLYDRGMREFSYLNGLEIPRNLEIRAAASAAPASPEVACAPEHGMAVPIGGGKDSVVVLEALRDLGAVPVSVNPNAASKRIASIAGRELLAIERVLDPHLFELNASGALNGHVPVTAIVSLVTIAAGYLFGYDTTVMALESSADSPSRVFGGVGGEAPFDVNHQWSKSAEFEEQLQQVLRESVHPDVRYFSPLRSFDELEITRAFATRTPYLVAFRSCNKVARLKDASDAWCLECPKCRFVFLALATALARKEVVAIFGADLLDDDSQLQGYADMLDQRTKPFECVGTVREVQDALTELLSEPDWSGASVLEHLRPRLSASRPEEVQTSARALSAEIFDAIRNAAVKGP
jgi:UDP-N-acetyl-alpha-D-muramoyl-L-alanyl-L-glutamate epimerase